MRIINYAFAIIAWSIFSVSTAVPAIKGTSPFVPVGTEDEVIYAGKLWQVLEQERVTGANMQPMQPFVGAAKPHGDS